MTAGADPAASAVSIAEQAARVVALLASEDASYVTGQVWNVDGGFR